MEKIRHLQRLIKSRFLYDTLGYFRNVITVGNKTNLVNELHRTFSRKTNLFHLKFANELEFKEHLDMKLDLESKLFQETESKIDESEMQNIENEVETETEAKTEAETEAETVAETEAEAESFIREIDLNSEHFLTDLDLEVQHLYKLFEFSPSVFQDSQMEHVKPAFGAEFDSIVITPLEFHQGALIFLLRFLLL